ncbi:helix-turn-helix domain-containing protein [Listeria valentina]|uniref:helix-turn-helix domain-containing protein n=1 Tax=Listeria valentina TaxID=2705293 RepID=UPI001430F46B|nr:helix-turn-helix transcriptional regulator [Listeria valentina]
MTTFDRVKKLADQRKLSLKELALKLNMGSNIIYKWKTQIPTTENLQKVADYFNVSTDYLLGRTDDPIPEKKDSKSQMYFRMNGEGLTKEEILELEQDLEDFMEIRRQRFLDRKNKG